MATVVNPTVLPAPRQSNIDLSAIMGAGDKRRAAEADKAKTARLSKAILAALELESQPQTDDVPVAVKQGVLLAGVGLKPSELVSTKSFLDKFGEERRRAKQADEDIGALAALTGDEDLGAIAARPGAPSAATVQTMGGLAGSKAAVAAKAKASIAEGALLAKGLPAKEQADLKGASATTVKTIYNQVRSDARQTQRQTAASKLLDTRLAAQGKAAVLREDAREKLQLMREDHREQLANARTEKEREFLQTRFDNQEKLAQKSQEARDAALTKRLDDLNARSLKAQKNMTDRQLAQFKASEAAADKRIAATEEAARLREENTQRRFDQREDSREKVARLKAAGGSTKQFDQQVAAAHNLLKKTYPNMTRDDAVHVVSNRPAVVNQLTRLYGSAVEGGAFEVIDSKKPHFRIASVLSDKFLVEGGTPNEAAINASQQANTMIAMGRIVPDKVWNLGKPEIVKQYLIEFQGILPGTAEDFVNDWLTSGVFKRKVEGANGTFKEPK